MKTTSLLTSFLFGSLAIAAPVQRLQRRAMVTKTATVVQTEVVYVTVWDGQVPVAAPTPTPGMFYEKPAEKPSSAAPQTTAAPVVSKPKEQKPEPTPTPEPTPEPKKEEPKKEEPKPVEQPKEEPKEEPKPVEQPKPEPTSAPAPAYTPTPSPEPVKQEQPAYTPAPEPAKEAPVTGGGNQFTGDVTVYDTYNGHGACGTILSDTAYTAAVSVESWGADVWGSADNINKNPWCGKKATVNLNGKSVTVTILDKCMGCKPGDIDVTRAAWNELTDGAYGSRIVGSWST